MVVICQFWAQKNNLFARHPPQLPRKKSEDTG